MRGTATAAAISTLYDKLDIDSDDPTWEGQRRAAGEVPVPGVNRQSRILIIFTDGMTQEEGAFIHPNNDAVDPTADFIQRRSPECTERYIAQNSGCRTDASIYARTQCRACDWVPTPHAERAFENDAVAIAAQRWKAQGYTVKLILFICPAPFSEKHFSHAHANPFWAPYHPTMCTAGYTARDTRPHLQYYLGCSLVLAIYDY